MAQDRYAITIAMGILMAIIATTAVLLRFEARHLRRAGLRTEDYLIVVSWVCLIGECVCNLVGAFGGRMGTHDAISLTIAPEVLKKHQIVAAKVIWSLQLLTTLGPGFTRASILLFYRKIFVRRTTRVLIWTFLALDTIWTISYFFANMFSCTPISGNWITNPTGHCVNFLQLYKSMVVSDVILNGCVLIIPWYPVYKLQMPIRQKFTVFGIFLLGGFVIISGIFRVIAMFDALSFDPDTTYNRAPAFYWATIEVGVGILSACLPTMRPLLDKSGPESILRSFTRRITGSSSKTQLSDSYTMDGNRPSHGTDAEMIHSSTPSSRGEPKIYSGPQRSEFKQQTTIESNEHRKKEGTFDGIMVEQNVYHSAQSRDNV